jgi:hypothetical protein
MGHFQTTVIVEAAESAEIASTEFMYFWSLPFATFLVLVVQTAIGV